MNQPGAANQSSAAAGYEVVASWDAPPAPPAGAPQASAGLMAQVIEATDESAAEGAEPPASASRLADFLQAADPLEALRLWFGGEFPKSRRELSLRLSRDVARLDEWIGRQANAIIHHPDFQQLEASWRGLEYLVGQQVDGSNVRIRVLNVTWKELTRDLERSIEFDNSQLFRKVYSEEFGTPGGEPFGVLLGDYQIHLRPSPEHRTDDLSALTAISQVAAAAFAPFIAAAHPSMFQIDHFAELERPINLQRTFEQLDYVKWKAFRESEDSRFVGLTLPRVLMRRPYGDEPLQGTDFRFAEDVSAPDQRNYLWGNPCYAFGGVLLRAFAESGWLGNIRGVRRGQETGGIVRGLPVQSFDVAGRHVIEKSSTDTNITDVREKELCELGFIPLCKCKDTPFSAFYSNASTQKPQVYESKAATLNARISSMLHYMFCVSRFTHYIKVLARDRVGSFADAEDCEKFLQDWLMQYVTVDADAPPEIKARFPLRDAHVQVREHAEKPGTYMCIVHLWPHYELDELTAAIRVKSELAPAQG